MGEEKTFAVLVCFKERQYWSRPYTYKSKVPYKVGDPVVVPTGDFYSVGRVTDCRGEYEFDSKINYKFVVGAVTALTSGAA